SVREHRGLT
nr:immunoglobulin heavy chain junction region [Mus musculus]